MDKWSGCEEFAKKTAQNLWGPGLSFERVQGGAQNVVFKVAGPMGSRALRISPKGASRIVERSLAWNALLGGAGVPVARMEASGHEAGGGFPWTASEWVGAEDLGKVYAGIGVEQRVDLARQIKDIQDKARSAIGKTQGFGVAASPSEPPSAETWARHISSLLSHRISKFASPSFLEGALLSSVKGWFEKEAADGVFDAVEPWGYMHDIADRNVLVADGQVKAIVDLDEVSHGDRLCAVALALVVPELEAGGRQYALEWARLELEDAKAAGDVGAPRRLGLMMAMFQLWLASQMGSVSNSGEIFKGREQRHAAMARLERMMHGSMRGEDPMSWAG